MERPKEFVHTIRSRLMLEVASELVGYLEWPYRQARIGLRQQGAGGWPVTLFGSDSPSTMHEVSRGEVQFAIINPAMLLTVAVRGTGPFKRPVPLKAIAVLPSFDQMIFAVRGDTGLKSLADIRERRFPLRVSLRGQDDHSLHIVLKEALSALDLSLDEIVEWGGEVRYDPGMPDEPNRLGAVERGEIHAVFDEGSRLWGNGALDLGMRFLALDDELLRRMEALGMRRAVLDKATFPGLEENVPTLDFSGWAIYTHADTPDWIVSSFCRALERRKDLIPWEAGSALPLERMVRDTPEGPLDVPLHPAAERFWREHGYLG